MVNIMPRFTPPYGNLLLISTLLLLMLWGDVAESGGQLGVFRRLPLRGALSSCRRLLQTRTRSLQKCLEQWMKLKGEAADPAFVHYTHSTDSRRCEISVWCDQLLLNESETRTALLPASQSPPRLVLFAVKSGSQVNVLDSFLTPVNCNRSLLVSPIVGPPPLDFWRSCWLERLPDLVRLVSGNTISVELLKNGVTVLKISFDARFSGLNATNWFSKDRLVASEPDLDLASRNFNYFSVAGHVYHDILSRSFFINMVYGGCPVDVGVLAVIDHYDACAWALTGNSTSALPRILYNLQAGLWKDYVQLADYMLVYVA